MQTSIVNLKFGFQVVYKGILTTPTFQSIGAAKAYIAILDSGYRKPEYVR